MQPRMVSLSPGALFRQVGDEAVILDVATEQYFGLDLVGGAIVGLIVDGAGPVNETDIVDAIAARFAAPIERIEHDLQGLVDQLVSLGLAQVSDPSDPELLQRT